MPSEGDAVKGAFVARAPGIAGAPELSTLQRLAAGLLGPLVLLGTWALVYELRLFEPTLLPSLGATGKALVRMFVSGDVLPDLAASMGRAGAGYGMAAAVGVLLGTIVGAYQRLYFATMPIVDFFRSVPVTTLYPVFVLTMGVGNLSKIGMVFTACVFVIMLNCAYGVMQANKVRAQMATLYGASRSQVFRWVIVFDALPQTMIGLRVALSLALIVTILCEMFMGCKLGLGQRLSDAYTTFSSDRMYAVVLLLGALGFLLNRLFVRLERRVVPWAGK